MTNIEIIRTWIKALYTNDFTTIKNLMSANYECRNPMTPNLSSANEHLGMLQSLQSVFEAHHELDMIIEENNYVVISGKWKGKHIGEFNGVPVT